ncbi:MAG TPA: right-handed parallel beta-helix repeat-containing protein [Acetobacteraceae bacterium]|nr:right-handed parallel beta-helix repeat-containing protein [Acetobacteraceae bacterium]
MPFAGRQALGVFAAGLIVLLAGCAPSVLMVGPTHELKLPSQAVAEASSGDTILIDPGVYRDCAVVKSSNVTIAGTGPGVVLTDRTCGGKAILVTKGDDITIRNLTLQHAHVPDRNGAGIRAEGYNLTVDGVRFLDNEEGILAGHKRGSTIRVLNSDFERNGTCAGSGCAHGVYVGHIDLLDVENSRFFEQMVGHHVKSRALKTVIKGNTIEDGPDGTASYEIDIPNGGDADIERNTIEKGPKAQNWSTAIAIGEERRGKQQSGTLVIRDNKFTNNNEHETLFVRNLSDDPVQLSGNALSGKVVPLQGQGTVQQAATPTPRS